MNIFSNVTVDNDNSLITSIFITYILLCGKTSLLNLASNNNAHLPVEDFFDSYIHSYLKCSFLWQTD